MSKGKGPTERSVQFLRELEKRARQNIDIPTDTAVRQRARSERTPKRIPLVAGVVAIIIALTVGEGLWGAKVGNAGISPASALDSSTWPSASAGSSSLLVAQNQDSTSPPDDQVPQSQQEGPPPAAQASVAPHPRAALRSVLSEHLSSELSQYLHQHHLPYVDAMVFSNVSGRPTLVKLSGQVRTEHGKEDAETKSSDFLNQPGLRVQNHVEVDASLATTAPTSSSGTVVPASSVGAAAGAPMAAAPNTAANPCTDLCLKDEGHCNTACQTQAASGATGGGGLQGLLGQFGQSATALKQCNDQCVQAREHCTYDCSSAASAAPPSEAADSGGAPTNPSDHRAEGPDTPPE